jgi:hypothetical protein
MTRLLRTLALALPLLASAPAAWPQAAPADTVRAEMAPLLEQAQKLLADGKPADALAPLAQAQALANRSAFENFIIDQLQGQAAARAGQDTLALDAFDRALAANRFKPEDLYPVQRLQMQLAYRAKLWPRTVGYARAVLKLPALPDDARLTAQQLLGQALYLGGQHAEAATEVAAHLDALAAAGRKPGEDQIKLLASTQLQLKNEAGYAAALERMVVHHPSPAYWADLISRHAKAAAPTPRLRLELLRLGRATGAFTDSDALLEAADIAQQLGLPGETRQVLKAGLDAGKFKPGADTSAAQQQLQRATAAAARDSAPADTAGLAPAALFGLGHALALDGQADRGLPLMDQALAKGGLREPGTAWLQLGSLQALASRPEARSTLQKVPQADPAQTLARLWLLHLR